jgi:hypothetical protein
MPIKSKTLLLVLVGFCFFSCSSTEGEGSIKTIDFSSPQLIDEDIQDWIQIQNTTQLAIPDSITIGRITQVEFTDSVIIMLEMGVAPSILVFDREGDFKDRISRVGNGPGEYAQIEFVVLRESSILVYDRSQQKFIDYSLADFSQFEESKSPDYFMGGLGSLPGDRLFLVSDSELETELYKGYGYFNSDLTENGFEPQFSGYIEAFLPQSISYFGEYPYMVQPFSEKVFQIGKDSLTYAFQIDFGAKTIPKEASELMDAEEFYEILGSGSYYFAIHNLLKKGDSVAFNFYNENIDNLNFGLIQNGQAYRFSIDSDLKEFFLKPTAVREDLFHTILLPGEYDEEVIELLNLTEVDYEKPILVSYFIGK